ncbi:MAG: TauD/TfdA family dioxygenase [Ilumatobacteraceae bacterium]
MSITTPDIELDVRAATATVGAEVRGVDLRRLDDPTQRHALRQAFATHQVLHLPALAPTPEQHIELARVFGDLTRPSSVKPSIAGHPEITEFHTGAGSEDGNGDNDHWHVDITFAEEPPGGSVLHGVEIPDVGGDTAFASTHAAFERLDPRWQRFLEGLEALHVPGSGILAGAAKYGLPEWEGTSVYDIPGTVHPVVIEHPVTGRKGIFVNPGFTKEIVGFSKPESDAVLRFVYAHVAATAHTVRFRWQPGSVVVWDNRAVWHQRVNDGDASRRVQRIQLKGERPRAAVA